MVLSALQDMAGRYSIGWRFRNPEFGGKSYGVRFYKNLEIAQRRFDQKIANDCMPMVPALRQDWQQQAVYQWESAFCYPFKVAMDQQGMQSMIRRVCSAYGMKAPRLIMEAHTDNSHYSIIDHSIHMGHRDNIGLLHELAHAVHEKDDDGNDVAPHNPAFVWTLIELYNRYAGFNLNYLIMSAGRAGLTGDLQMDQLVEPVTDRGRDLKRIPACPSI